MQSPSTVHYSAVKRILRYLTGTRHLGLLFSALNLDLYAYCDADWAGDSLDRRSTSGFVAFLGDSPISWTTKKQTTVSRSSTEAEYRSLAGFAVELY